MSNAIPRAAGMTLGLLLVAGCAGGGTLPPPTPVIDTIWSDRLPANAAPRRADWRRAFTDPVLDALVAHGDADAIAARLDEHLTAGASHVTLHSLPDDADPLETYREIAAALHR